MHHFLLLWDFFSQQMVINTVTHKWPIFRQQEIFNAHSQMRHTSCCCLNENVLNTLIYFNNWYWVGETFCKEVRRINLLKTVCHWERGSRFLRIQGFLSLACGIRYICLDMASASCLLLATIPVIIVTYSNSRIPWNSKSQISSFIGCFGHPIIS